MLSAGGSDDGGHSVGRPTADRAWGWGIAVAAAGTFCSPLLAQSPPLFPLPEFLDGMLISSGPHSVAVGDLDEDGKADIVTANDYGGSLLLGNGAGDFGAANQFLAGNKPVAVAIADFNGDGHLDIVAASKLDGAVSLLSGNGSGGFAPAQILVMGHAPDAMSVADLNGDGRPDIITVEEAGAPWPSGCPMEPAASCRPCSSRPAFSA